MFCPRWLQLLLTTLGINLFSACLIIGLTLPGLINYTIDTAIKSQTVLEKGKLSDSSYQNFTESIIDAYYYVFNVTNADQVLLGAKPNVVVSPAVHLLKWEERLNITSANGQTTFNRCMLYSLYDDAAAALLSQPVTIVNPVYLGAAAQIGQLFWLQNQVNGGNIPSLTTNFVSASDSPFYNDLLLNLYVQNKSLVWPTFNSLFSSPSSSFISAVKTLSLNVYISAAVTTLLTKVPSAVVPATSSTEALLHICSGGNAYPAYKLSALSAAFYNFTGLEFSTPLSSFNSSLPVTAAAQPAFATACLTLFNTGNSYSLLSLNGLTSTTSASWVSLLAALNSNQQATAATIIVALASGNGVTVTDISNVAAWFAGLIGPALLANAGLSDPYTAIVMQAVNSKITSYDWYTGSTYKNNTDFLPQAWTDLGLFQWGTGLLATMFVDLSSGSTLANSGYAISVTNSQLLGTSILTAAGLDTHVILEFAAACAGTYAVPVLLTPKQSAALLNLLSIDIVPQAVVYLTIEYMLQSSAVTVTAAVTKVCALLACSSTAAATYISVLTPIMSSSPYVVACAFKAFGNVNTYTSLTLPSGNSGLFVTTTIGEVLFGQKTTQLSGASIPGVVQSSWSYLFGYSGNPLTKQQVIDQVCAPAEYSRLNTVMSGSSDLSKLGQYIQYESVSSFQTYCQYKDPSGIDTCAGTDSNSGLPKKQAANFNMWGEPLQIQGLYEGTWFPPFQEDNIVPSYNLWIYNAFRSLQFNYYTSLTLKGLNVRRYVVDQRVLFNATTDLTNPQRNFQIYYENPATWPNAVVNLAPASGGVPVSVSQPMLLGCDNTVLGLLTGIDTDPTHSSNYISFLDVEPLTGRTVNAAKRLQANFYLNPAQYSWFSPYTKFFQSLNGSTIHIPYYYAQESSTITDSDASDLKSSVFDTRNTAHQASIALIVVGAIFTFVFIVLLLYLVCVQKQQ